MPQKKIHNDGEREWLYLNYRIHAGLAALRFATYWPVRFDARCLGSELRSSKLSSQKQIVVIMKTLSLNAQRPRGAVFVPHRSVRCDAAPLDKPAGTRLFVGRRFGITLVTLNCIFILCFIYI